jgi:uncharacterized protein (DUF1015 family)
MAEIRPFYGLRYNQTLASNLGDLLCPPFDVISPAAQQGFYDKNPYNIIRLEHGQEFPTDTPKNNKYTRSAATLKSWIKDGVLTAEEKPTIYYHQHFFTRQNHTLCRSNLIACVRSEEWDKGIIKPHEFTRSAAKTDRLDLMRACQSNFSLPMALYDDPDDKLAELLAPKGQPLETADAGEEKHLVWAISQPDIIAAIQNHMASRSLYIADGHHRYETALAYRDEQRLAHPKWSKDDAFNFIMISLISTSDPGLLVLPTHRLLKGVSAEAISELKVRLETLFEIEDVPVKQQDYALNLMRRSDRAVMGLVGLDPTNFKLLFSRKDISVKAQVSLLIRMLHREILEGVVDNSAVSYDSEAKEAINKVLSNEYQLAFLLNPPSVEEIKAASDGGERMPHKSTFFYPKPPTGLVIRKLEGRLP